LGKVRPLARASHYSTQFERGLQRGLVIRTLPCLHRQECLCYWVCQIELDFLQIFAGA